MQSRNRIALSFYAPFALACAAIGPAVALAEGITLIHEGTGAGTLDGVPFPSSNFVVTAVGDTNNRDSFGGGFSIDHSSAKIFIEGIGTLDILTGTRTFVNNGGNIVGLSRATVFGLDLFNGPADPAFAGWDMLSSIGPISGEGGLLQWIDDPMINTSAGILVFDSGGSPATFTAIIPAPLTTGLLAIAGAAAAAVRRRQ